MDNNILCYRNPPYVREKRYTIQPIVYKKKESVPKPISIPSIKTYAYMPRDSEPKSGVSYFGDDGNIAFDFGGDQWIDNKWKPGVEGYYQLSFKIFIDVDRFDPNIPDPVLGLTSLIEKNTASNVLAGNYARNIGQAISSIGTGLIFIAKDDQFSMKGLVDNIIPGGPTPPSWKYISGWPFVANEKNHNFFAAFRVAD